jgi:hypothetical protein
MSRELDLKEYFNALTKEQLVERMYKTEIAMKQNIKTAIECAIELEEALTPPTEDEVCKALSKWFGTQVFYEEDPFEERPNMFIKRSLFYYGKKRLDMNKKEYTHKSIIVIGSEDLITFNSQLPPHIIEMIAKFYKGSIEDA